MRPALLCTLVGAWLLALGLPASSSVRTSAAAPSQPVSAGKAALLRVEGEWQLTRDEALRVALVQAQDDIVQTLQKQGTTVQARPSVNYVETRLLRSQEEEIRTFDGVGVMRRYVLEVQVTPEVRQHLLQQDREQRTQQRMLLLGKVLGGLVVFLAAAALYFRCDELTKGYYSTWLRLAAAGVVLATVLVLLL